MVLDIIYHAFVSGSEAAYGYLAAHVLTCLVPAFFIAGAIGVFLKKDAILRYFGPSVSKWKSYSVASVSGAILAVCSCTILPLFTGIYKKGSGIGPATTFLYAGPAINVLAVIYTAQVLGYDLGIARAVGAIGMSVLIGLVMALIFERGKKVGKKKKDAIKGADSVQSTGVRPFITDTEKKRPKWVVPVFFLAMIMVLIIGSSKLDGFLRLAIVYVLTLGVALILIYYFTKDEVTEWGWEVWDLTKKIFPILLIGAFVVGVIAYFLPPSEFKPYLGDNSLLDNFIAAVIGSLLYMPTLLEVPIIGGTFGYTSGAMADGPALALLLSGPSISLPSIIVLNRILGWKKTSVYVGLVVVCSTLAGFAYGNLIGLFR